MISKQELLNIVHKVAKGRKSKSAHRLVFPMRDWLTGLFIFLLVITGVIAYDVILFSHYTSLETTVKAQTKKGTVLDKDLVGAVILDYEKRQDEFSRLRAFGQVDTVEEGNASTNTTTEEENAGDGPLSNSQSTATTESSSQTDTSTDLEQESPSNDGALIEAQ